MASSFDRQAFIQVQTVAEFLELLRTSFRDRPLSYAELGRIAGLRSRSHPRELILGQKRISLELAAQIARGFKLPVDLKDLFLLLAEQEAALDPAAQARVAKDLRRLRQQMENRSLRRPSDPEPFFTLSDASLVYASLGSMTQGAPLSMIAQKSRLDPEQVTRILDHLLAKGFVQKRDDRYWATDVHLQFDELRPGSSFPQFYEQRLRQAVRRSQAAFQSPDELFWEATLSVKIADLERLKNELRQTLIRFASEAEAGDGEALRSLTVGFIDPRPYY